MKSRWIIGLLITGALVISAAAQDINGAQLAQAMPASLPRQQSNSTPMALQLQPAPANDQTAAYVQPMQGVLESLAEELGLIAQAVHDGKITAAQGEYLSVERYYTALMRLQLLRTLQQTANDASRSESYSGTNTAGDTTADTSGDVVVVSPPTSSPDVVSPMVAYLGLNQAQLAAIQRQISADRQEVAPLLKRLEQSRRKLVEATLDGKCDVKKIQALAAEQSRILKQLIVANSLLEAKVYSMLTPEQQHKVDDLRRQGLTAVQASSPDWGQQ